MKNYKIGENIREKESNIKIDSGKALSNTKHL